jgi:hypothetical protein
LVEHLYSTDEAQHTKKWGIGSDFYQIKKKKKKKKKIWDQKKKGKKQTGDYLET